jgi:hypothetical protein
MTTNRVYGGDAFLGQEHNNDGGEEFRVPVATSDMSLRDWFAGIALGAVLAAQIEATRGGRSMLEPAKNAEVQAARAAYDIADSMIAERNK